MQAKIAGGAPEPRALRARSQFGPPRLDNGARGVGSGGWDGLLTVPVVIHAGGRGESGLARRIHFDRQLDPAWYFSPWERVVVSEAARWLIEANATPTEAR